MDPTRAPLGQLPTRAARALSPVDTCTQPAPGSQAVPHLGRSSCQGFLVHMDGAVRQKASFFQVTLFVPNFPFIISRFWLLGNYIEGIIH